MIVPGKKKYLPAGRFAKGNLKQGETFSVDSGLGGSFTVAFDRWEGASPVFVREPHGDFPRAEYRYKDAEEAARHVYIVVPENPTFEEWQIEEAIKRVRDEAGVCAPVEVIRSWIESVSAETILKSSLKDIRAVAAAF